MHSFIRAASALLFPFVPATLVHAQAQTVTITSTKDNTLYFSPTGGLSNGAGPGMFAGLNGTGEARRGLAAFDLSGSIPLGSTVTSVSVQMEVVQTGTGSGAVELHRVVADWGEGTSVATSGGGGGGAPATTGDATWLHRFVPGTFWASPGGDFIDAISASVIVSGLGTHTWASTSELVVDVQGWVNDPARNFGWGLLTPETSTDRAKRFATREFPTASQRPQLTVTFVPPPGATFRLFGNGCSGSAGVPALAPQAGSLPALGQTFRLSLGNLPPAGTIAIGILGFSTTANNTPIGAYPLPSELSRFGLPGCTQYVSADWTPVVPAASGQAVWSLMIPPLAGLIRLQFHVQALVPDLGVNPFGATVSNAGTGTIGG